MLTIFGNCGPITGISKLKSLVETSERGKRLEIKRIHLEDGLIRDIYLIANQKDYEQLTIDKNSVANMNGFGRVLTYKYKGQGQIGEYGWQSETMVESFQEGIFNNLQLQAGRTLKLDGILQPDIE